VSERIDSDDRSGKCCPLFVDMTTPGFSAPLSDLALILFANVNLDGRESFGKYVKKVGFVT
jgi:hypothetical protein